MQVSVPAFSILRISRGIRTPPLFLCGTPRPGTPSVPGRMRQSLPMPAPVGKGDLFPALGTVPQAVGALRAALELDVPRREQAAVAAGESRPPKGDVPPAPAAIESSPHGRLLEQERELVHAGLRRVAVRGGDEDVHFFEQVSRLPVRE